ncbi:S8 family serine peptidase [Ornithinimicrobium sp. F0845]|uniref:S8 family serine peptidase n=1 Tax=Ornithinimicrobium sp. F0845 TaxID=2926412 RepID=UPI001FF5FDE2|nr:S8 family serine peptidase [Ornithinimicrobium sp. F0845]MCK0114116.1 S8 family serine peptidase [Ornithinimicrobium sp. F0845]
MSRNWMARAASVTAGAALFAAATLAGPAPAVQASDPDSSAGPVEYDAARQQSPRPEDKVQPGLARKFEKSAKVDFWVRFERDDDTDLSAAAANGDWDQRGAEVVEALKEESADHQAEVITALKRSNASYKTFWATDAVYVENGSRALAEELAVVPAVDGLWPSRTYQSVEPVSNHDAQATADAVEWGVANIKADQVWAEGDSGEGIVIANIDSGVQFDHPALVEQYRGTNGDGTFTHDYNWLDTDGSCSAGPCDHDGHGTHTMGTMVGSDGGDNQIGVAPGATWITANGCSTCSDVDLIEAGQWMLAPTKLDGSAADPSKRPHIINNSWGTRIPSNDPFMEDISEAWAASGIFAIWSNGNNGPECQTAGSPGSRTINYSVGAYDMNNTIGSFSSRGSGQDGGIKPHISAPGVNVRSAAPGGGYKVLSGTSMAAPHTSGALALLWSAQPDLIGDLPGTTEILDETAIDTEDLQCGGTAENNNVYGEGRLDALALVEAGDRGPIGTLAGDVTDAEEGTPLAAATVEVTGGEGESAVDREVTVDDEGHFITKLPVGDYEVTATSFGYGEESASVTVSEGTTTTQDFSLTALPTATVSGTVTDGSGQGWPLYAQVSVAGAPALTLHTDPRDGSFSLDVPTGTSYDLSVSPAYPGYQTLTRSVEVSGDTTVDLAVPVQQSPCVAPGYHQQQPKIALVSNDPGFEYEEYLGGYGIDATFFTTSQLAQIQGYDLVLWTSNYTLPTTEAFQDLLARTDASGTGIVFTDFAFGLGNGVAALSKVTGNPMTLERRNASGSGTFYEVTQEHPVLADFQAGDRIGHLGGAQTAWFTGYEGEGRQVLAGAGDATRGVSGPGIGVQERANNRHVLLSMHARGAGSWLPESEKIFWNALDWANPSDQAFACAADEGGAMLVGTVTDANTGEGLIGAQISVGDVSTESTATPASGSYWLYSPADGQQQLTVTAPKYETWTGPVDLDGFAVADATLNAGQLSVTPAEVELTQELGSGTETRSITLTNTGTAPLDIRVGERDRGFVLQGADGRTTSRNSITAAEGAPVHWSDAPVEVGAPGASGGGDSVEQESAPHVDPWIDIADSPAAVMDNAVVRLDGKIYSIAGYGSGGALSSAWAYDPATLAWSEVASLPAPRSGMTAGVIDGRIVATGGWDENDVTQGDTWVYDPGANSWAPVATNPEGRAGAAAAVVNGRLFAIGGCTTAQCNPMSASAMAYDVASDEWQRMSDYPMALAYSACGTIDWTIYCSGGIGSDVTNRTYAYDPGADTWVRKADAPYDVWGSANSVANDLLVIVGGVQRGQITNQAFGYDPVADSWTGLPGANTVLYRGGGACGLYKVGGSPQGYNPNAAAEMLPGYDQCSDGSADVGWVSTDKSTATLAVGETTEILVTTDSTVDQPGTYTAGLAILESTPYPQPEVEVSMIVTPPRSWSKVAGVVSGVACDGLTTLLDGATVQFSSPVMERTFRTDADGSFAHWLDKKRNSKRNGELTVFAAKDGYSIESESVRVSAGKTSEVALDLDEVGCS